MIEELNEEQTAALKSIVQHFRKEDLQVYLRQCRNAKKLKYYWDGITYLWQDGVAHDWRIWDGAFVSPNADPADQMFYDKNINIFKAFLESIIAAMSVTTPTVVGYPDDATNSEDIATAKASNKIRELWARHNDVQLMWIHALFIYCTEGLTWSYQYKHYDDKYGSYEENEYDDVEEEITANVCSVCKSNVVPDNFTNTLKDEFDPSANETLAHDLFNAGEVICPDCNNAYVPEQSSIKIRVERLVGKIHKPKGRICVEVYGGLNVKSPTYARTFTAAPYISLTDEINVLQAMDLYEEFAKDLDPTQKIQPGTSDDTEYRLRINTQYMGQTPDNLVTRERMWLRSWSFNYLKDEEQVKFFKKEFPFGCCVTSINDQVVEVYAENMDDHWTPTVNPNGDFLQFDPLGNTLVSIQDIIRDMTSLTLQTIEQGIPQVFADPGVIDFGAYSQLETQPGRIYPAKPNTGKSLGDSILTLKTSQLGGEVLPFTDKILESGQLASGALPSLYGGSQDNSSKTATQYSMSRNMALQRLKTAWTMTSFWWKNTFGKVIPAYIECVRESGDERFTKKNESGDFINVEIRRSELMGKLGSIELESTEDLPTTWAQKKDLVMQLLQSPNPAILEAITLPENLPVLREALGLQEFKLPGENDREKQIFEIRQLLMGEATPNPETGEEMPSVDVEPFVDNHLLEAEVCKSWLKSDEGQLTKIENPAGYKNVLLHMRRHTIIAPIVAQMMGAGPMQDEQNENKPAIAKGTPDEQRNPVAN